MRRLLIGVALALGTFGACAAQVPSTLTVKSGTGASVSIAGQTDASGNYHYRDVMEGLTGAGAPTAVTIDGAGNMLVALSALPLPAGAATAASQTVANSYLSNIAGTVYSGVMTVSDANNAAFSGVQAMTVGVGYTARRSVGANCTVAGNMSVIFTDTSTLTVPVVVGWQTFPFAITQVSATTGTCSFYNLK